MAHGGPNAEFISCWNDIIAPKWTRFRDLAITAFSCHSVGVIDDVATPGARVIDVGCGWGDTAVALARRVGAGGAVLGVDCVPAFLEFARATAAREGLDNVRFVDADAQTHPFEPGWDVVFARFGTMFFASPVWALRNLGRATRPGARLAMIVWRPIEENPWLGLAKRIALEHLPKPEEPAATCGPGPFSMASREVVAPILEAAGWRDATWRAIDARVPLGTLDDAVAMAMALGPAGEIVREAGERGEAKREVVARAIADEYARHLEDGVVMLPSASWCIEARWPS